jgi:hypothetical protein
MSASVAMAILGVLAALGSAFWFGTYLGSLRARAALLTLPIERATWAALCRDLHRENGELRCVYGLPELERPAAAVPAEPAPGEPGRATMPSVIAPTLEAEVERLRRRLIDEAVAADAEIRRLRDELTAAKRPAEAAAAPGPPNALARLRTRLGFGCDEVALALGIPLPDVDTLEHTSFGLLEVDAVERFVGAVGCRLDVVAVHIDGAAVWLSDERGSS